MGGKDVFNDRERGGGDKWFQRLMHIIIIAIVMMIISLDYLIPVTSGQGEHYPRLRFPLMYYMLGCPEIKR